MMLLRITQLILLLFYLLNCHVQYALGDFPHHGFSKHIYDHGKTIELKDGLNLTYGTLRSAAICRELGELRNIKFDKATLEHAYLTETTFINCTFRGANMKGVEAEEGYFEDCDFTDAIISGARFVHLRRGNLLQTWNFKVKSLRDTTIVFWGEKDNDRQEVDFSEFDFENAWIPSDLTGCTFNDANITGARISTMTPEQLRSTKNYKRGSLAGVKFICVDFSNMDFRRMNFTGGGFLWTCLGIHGGKAEVSNVKGADFTGAIITDCDFTGAKDFSLAQLKSTWNYKVGRMEGVKLPKELQAQLDAEKKKEGENESSTP